LTAARDYIYHLIIIDAILMKVLSITDAKLATASALPHDALLGQSDRLVRVRLLSEVIDKHHPAAHRLSQLWWFLRHYVEVRLIDL
jgi:hypothetical protein